MARLNDDAQWIVLMGFLVSFGLFFLALIINQSTVVGQTTAESVSEFPKNDIRDVRHIIGEATAKNYTLPDEQIIYDDIHDLSMYRKGAVVDYHPLMRNTTIWIQYNNGVTEYNETWTRP